MSRRELPRCFEYPSASPRMKLFLIRHGETEHNIAGLLAGVTDSSLTHHGVLQTQRLAKYLVNDRNFRFTHVYASDLTRAFMTADEICKAQNGIENATTQIEITKLQLLREQDFGSLELVPWSSRRDLPALNPSILDHNDPSFRAKETVESMKRRADSFLDDFMIPLLIVDDSHKMCIAVVSHGIFLGTLWRSILGRLKSQNVILDTSLVSATGNQLPHLRPGWSNTGFLEVELKYQPPPGALSTDDSVAGSRSVSPTTLPSKECREPRTSAIHRQLVQQERKSISSTSTRHCEANLACADQSNTMITLLWKNIFLSVKAINGKDHLLNFKRARGGLGSMAFDKRQTKLEGFFKKTKTESNGPDHYLRSKTGAT